MQEHLFKHFNSMGHISFLKNVSVKLSIKQTEKNLKREMILQEEKFELNFEVSIEESV